MSRETSMYDCASEVRDAISSLEQQVKCSLEDVRDAAETLTPQQVYTAVALHAILRNHTLQELQALASEHFDLEVLAGVAVKIGDAVYKRELELLTGNQP